MTTVGIPDVGVPDVGVPDVGVPDRDADWCVVLPVKLLSRAKTRLGGTAGVLRAELAAAFAADTVTAALRCPEVRTVTVVTNDPTASTHLAALGARLVADVPNAGLNAALVHAVRQVRRDFPGRRTAAVSADLPTLRPEELGRALRAAAGHPVAFVADAAGTGTTLLATGPRTAFHPAFGARSRAAHQVAGGWELDPTGLDSVRLDVDTAADLAAAVRLGVGVHTSAVVARLPPLR